MVKTSKRVKSSNPSLELKVSLYVFDDVHDQRARTYTSMLSTVCESMHAFVCESMHAFMNTFNSTHACACEVCMQSNTRMHM